MKLFLSPHNDDECLWGTFTLLREKPLVVVVADSFNQQNRGLPITAKQRRLETLAAMLTLGVLCEFLGFRDDLPFIGLETLLKGFGEPEMVYAPAHEEGGHPHHNQISDAARSCFQNVTYYMTYTNRMKSRGVPVPFEREWPLLKLKALACYESQVNEASTQPHFMGDQWEYYQA